MLEFSEDGVQLRQRELHTTVAPAPGPQSHADVSIGHRRANHELELGHRKAVGSDSDSGGEACEIKVKQLHS